MNPDEIACLGFSYLYGIGPWKFSKLVAHFGSPHRALSASEDELRAFGAGKYIDALITFRRSFDGEMALKVLKEKHIQYISTVSDLYPSGLQQISDPPIGLFCIGNTNLLVDPSFCFAVVGTRKPSLYGQTMAKKISSELVAHGVIIISGLALGIDTCAHQGALSGNGKTIAVLGCGVDIPYPRANILLYRNILETGGLIISEFPPGTTVLPGLFVARNRIISGLSKGVLIVEGSLRSGSLITATYAANQGRELFALPGQVTTEGAAAPLMLLKQGAHLVTETADILSELGIAQPKIRKHVSMPTLTTNERMVVSVLQGNPVTTDGLLGRRIMDPTQMMATLSQLEIRGIIVRNQEGVWEIA